jgi:hypothetical protein
MVELSAGSSAAALEIAAAGLAEASSRLEFVQESGEVHTVLDAIDAAAPVDAAADVLHTATVRGTVAIPATGVEPSINYHGDILAGDRLREKVQSWVKLGTIEPSAAAALTKVLDTREWLDLSGRLFVVMGAGAAMGPTEVLLSLGATVVALDIPVKVGALLPSPPRHCV